MVGGQTRLSLGLTYARPPDPARLFWDFALGVFAQKQGDRALIPFLGMAAGGQ